MPDNLGPVAFYRTADKTFWHLRPQNVDNPTGPQYAEGTRFVEKQDSCGRIATVIPTIPFTSLAEAQRLLTRSYMPCRTPAMADEMYRIFQLAGTRAEQLAKG